jgi:hypothetical protein
MSELQNDDSGITYDEPVEQEAQEIEQIEDAETENEAEVSEQSDLAPDSPDEGEQNTEDGEDNTPDWLKKKIAKQTFAQRQAERERDELKKRLEDFERKAQPVLSKTDVPPIPDSWDDNYEAKIRERDNAIMQNAKFEAAEAQRLQAQAEQQRKLEREQFNRQQELSETLEANSKKLGVDRARLDSAQEVLVKQISESGRDMTRIVDRLLSDPMGALMIQHLAQNQLDMHDIIYASPEDAGFLLAEVKQKAARLKPKPSSAPSPATTLSGRGSPQAKRDDDGTTFE